MNITDKLQQILPLDKAYHVIAGTITYAVCSFFIGYYALLCVVVVAVLKEGWDHFQPSHTAELKDIIATTAGGLIGLLCNVS